jgi:uncharacterized protein YjbJ (UPF0337 family)
MLVTSEFKQRSSGPMELSNMDKNRIAGAAKQAKGAVKEATGKALGDKKLVADGKSDKVEGKIQNAVGGLKDALKK